jgi:hypothetical protein
LTYPIIIKCPVCSERLKVTTLHCSRCNTRFEGEFHLDKFSYLTQEQKNFIEVFLKCRGNIKEVEKELNISYPTVRGKLDDVVQSLGYKVSSDSGRQKSRKEILEMLSSGEITYDEAMNLLKG